LLYVVVLFVKMLLLRRISDSCLTVSNHRQLSQNLLPQDGEFTLTAWFQSSTLGGAVTGTLLSLTSSYATSNASLVQYWLGFTRLDNSSTAVQFSLQVYILADIRPKNLHCVRENIIPRQCAIYMPNLNIN